jgi:hypothetical protein
MRIVAWIAWDRNPISLISEISLLLRASDLPALIHVGTFRILI